jgi:hypothetical protein
VFNAVTVIKAHSCNTHKLKISYSSKEQVFDHTFLNFDLLLLLQNTLPLTVNYYEYYENEYLYAHNSQLYMRVSQKISLQGNSKYM